MKLHTIWVSHDGSWDGAWLKSAWDEYSIEENPEGFDAAVKEAADGNHTHRVIVVDASDAALEEAWRGPVVGGSVVPQEEKTDD